MSDSASMRWLYDAENWRLNPETQTYQLQPVPAERFEDLKRAIAKASLSLAIDELVLAVNSKDS